MGHRNRILYLMEIYEMLIEGRQTFYSIRQEIGIGYNALKELLEFLKKNEYVYERVVDDMRYFECTEALVQLFEGRLYDGIKELENI